MLERARELKGYQSYLIEQWACSRNHPTFIVTALTGDLSHSIKVDVLGVSADEKLWPPRLKAYMKALTQHHARRKETTLGTLMITNLSSFPSSLTIILIPGGDVKKHRTDFFVNENLKRLGCAGRSGITLAEPTASTQAKFQQLYKTSDRVPLYTAVVELVKTCQLALVLFGQLASEYADGLLCDVTEKAITDWWVDIGTDYYNIEPNDGILGPSTVAALVGTSMGARNRLNVYGAPIGKDVFDMESTKNALSYFQRAQKIHRTRRLDRSTLDRLHKATAKHASGEGRFVPRALKSTVADLSGKGGEMVMEMVGAKDKANLADVESVDIERLVELIHGERAKWLWKGKPKRRTTRDIFEEAPRSSRHEEAATISRYDTRKELPLARSETRNTLQDPARLKRTTTASTINTMSSPYEREGNDVDPILRHAVLQRAKGRLRDVVGIRGHATRVSKEDAALYNAKNKSAESFESQTNDAFMAPRRTGSSYGDVGEDSDPIFSPNMSQTAIRSSSIPCEEVRDHDARLSIAANMTGAKLQQVETAGPTVVEDNTKPDLEYDLPSFVSASDSVGILLRRTQSNSNAHSSRDIQRHDGAWPRHLSFSGVEDAICPPNLHSESGYETNRDASLKQRLIVQMMHAQEAKQMRQEITLLSLQVARWVQAKIEDVEGLAVLAGQDVEQLTELYDPRKREYRSLREGAEEVLAEERARLEESLKELDTFRSKLEYEINSLRGKVEEAEDAVAEFDKQVTYTEYRVRELAKESSKEGWFAWLGRITTGFLQKEEAKK